MGDVEKIILYNGVVLKRHNCLYKLLIEQRRNVLFVGEGNFTFTLAFAALRKYCWYSNPVKQDDWHGIVSTRYEYAPGVLPANQSGAGVGVFPPPDPKAVRRICLENSNDKFPKSLLLKDHPSPREIIESFSESPGDCYCGIDARDIPPQLIPHKGVIWFQCPWSIDPGQLIHDFLTKTAPKLFHEDSYICVGITKHSDYVRKYKLESLMRDVWAMDKVLHSYYEFVGADDDLIYQILGFGYRHQSLSQNDIHDYIRDHHLTLVFQRRSPMVDRRMKL